MSAARHFRTLAEAPVPVAWRSRLAGAVRELDDGSRALLDLSLRRGIRDDAMAQLLRTDPFHLAWRRARLIERLAAEVRARGPDQLAEVRAALAELPDVAWMVPRGLPRPATGEPQAARPAPAVEEQRTGETIELEAVDPGGEDPIPDEPADVPIAEALEVEEDEDVEFHGAVPLARVRRTIPPPATAPQPAVASAPAPATARPARPASLRTLARPAVRTAARGVAIAGVGVAVGLLLGRRRRGPQISIRA
jgi:hypothetical protein